MTERHLVIVNPILDGELDDEDKVRFKLDSRFQDEAINELVARGQNITYEAGAVHRDPSQAITIEGMTPVWASIIMKHDRFRRDQPNVIDREFKELV